MLNSPWFLVFKRLGERLLDLIYPRWCLVCGINLQASSAHYVCPDCIDKIDYIPPEEACPRCGYLLGPYRTDTKNIAGCPDCRGKGLAFIKQVIPVGRYENILRDLILKFKYGKERLLANPLARLLIQRLGTSNIVKHADLIIPVPLHPKKHRARGFNQANLIARYLNQIFRLPISAKNLVRIKNIPAQVVLPRQARLNNPRDAFKLRYPAEVNKKNILLVDDVLTTGGTAQEIGRVLRAAGAHHIYVAVLAR